MKKEIDDLCCVNFSAERYTTIKPLTLINRIVRRIIFLMLPTIVYGRIQQKLTKYLRYLHTIVKLVDMLDQFWALTIVHNRQSPHNESRQWPIAYFRRTNVGIGDTIRSYLYHLTSLAFASSPWWPSAIAIHVDW